MFIFRFGKSALKRPEPAFQQHRLGAAGGGAFGGFGVDAPLAFLEGFVQTAELEGVGAEAAERTAARCAEAGLLERWFKALG